MSKMIQIRNVPDEVHRVLKARAAREGMTLSDYIKRELKKSADLPSMQEWLDRMRKVKPIPVKRSPVDVIREMRDSR